MLANDDAVEQIVYGNNGVLEGLEEGGVHVSSSTISIDLSERLEKDHHEQKQQHLSWVALMR